MRVHSFISITAFAASSYYHYYYIISPTMYIYKTPYTTLCQLPTSYNFTYSHTTTHAQLPHAMQITPLYNTHRNATEKEEQSAHTPLLSCLKILLRFAPRRVQSQLHLANNVNNRPCWLHPIATSHTCTPIQCTLSYQNMLVFTAFAASSVLLSLL